LSLNYILKNFFKKRRFFLGGAGGKGTGSYYEAQASLELVIPFLSLPSVARHNGIFLPMENATKNCSFHGSVNIF
jgi:hypothetical protein